MPHRRMKFLKRKFSHDQQFMSSNCLIPLSAKNKWTYGTNSHSFLLYFASEMCKALWDLPATHENRVKVLDLHLLPPFPTYNFYELHTLAGQELDVNNIVNGFYWNDKFNESGQSMTSHGISSPFLIKLWVQNQSFLRLRPEDVLLQSC